MGQSERFLGVEGVIIGSLFGILYEEEIKVTISGVLKSGSHSLGNDVAVLDAVNEETKGGQVQVGRKVPNVLTGDVNRRVDSERISLKSKDKIAKRGLGVKTIVFLNGCSQTLRDEDNIPEALRASQKGFGSVLQAADGGFHVQIQGAVDRAGTDSIFVRELLLRLRLRVRRSVDMNLLRVSGARHEWVSVAVGENNDFLNARGV